MDSIMQMEWSYVGAVVISGLVIVFVALILLIIAVSIMGKIFDSIKASKAAKAKTIEVTETKKETVPAPAPVQAAAPETGEDEEIVAVIAAAVAAIAEESGTPLKIKSIRRAAQGGSRSNAWARAAANESTRAF